MNFIIVKNKIRKINASKISVQMLKSMEIYSLYRRRKLNCDHCNSNIEGKKI